MPSSFNGLVVLGIALVIGGTAGFALAGLTTRQPSEVTRIGHLQPDATEHNARTVSPLLSGGIFVLGVLLIGAGFVQRRAASAGSRSGLGLRQPERKEGRVAR